MSDAPKLKPCPFCGNDGSGPIEEALQICGVDMEGCWKAAYAYSVQCDKCTATMGLSETEGEAVDAWNTRADLSADRIEELETKLAKANKTLSRMVEGWGNALELDIIAPQHRTSAGILRDEARATLAEIQDG